MNVNPTLSQRVRDIVTFYRTHSTAATAEHFGISPRSVYNYVNMARHVLVWDAPERADTANGFGESGVSVAATPEATPAATPAEPASGTPTRLPPQGDAAQLEEVKGMLAAFYSRISRFFADQGFRISGELRDREGNSIHPC